MQGQLVGRNMEDELLDSFSVFRSDSIDVKQLKLMSQVIIPSMRRDLRLCLGKNVNTNIE